MVESTNTKSNQLASRARIILRLLRFYELSLKSDWYLNHDRDTSQETLCGLRISRFYFGELAKELLFKIIHLHRVNSTCKPRNKLPENEHHLPSIYIMKSPFLTSNIHCHFTQHVNVTNTPCPKIRDDEPSSDGATEALRRDRWAFPVGSCHFTQLPLCWSIFAANVETRCHCCHFLGKSMKKWCWWKKSCTS